MVPLNPVICNTKLTLLGKVYGTNYDAIAHTFGQSIQANYGDIEEYSECIFLCPCCPHLIIWIWFPFLTLFIIIFGLGFYKNLGYLLRFILVRLISCHASQSYFFVFAMGHFNWPITQKLRAALPLFYRKVTCFYMVM
jgi:hypothetical protein